MFSLQQESMETSCVEGLQPSAPLKTAKIQVKVNLSGLPREKWHTSLHKALQSWCNSDLSKYIGKCEVYTLTFMQDDPLCAEVQILPFKGETFYNSLIGASLSFYVIALKLLTI